MVGRPRRNIKGEVIGLGWDAENERIHELLDKTPEQFREAFLDEEFQELLKSAGLEDNEQREREI